MKYLMNKSTKSVIATDAHEKSIDQIAGFVKMMHDKGYDTDVYLTEEQLNRIENNETDATFFALLNTGLFLKK